MKVYDFGQVINREDSTFFNQNDRLEAYPPLHKSGFQHFFDPINRPVDNGLPTGHRREQ